MKIVIVGSGPIGSGTAKLLAKRGHEVTLAAKSGAAPGVAVGHTNQGRLNRARVDAANAGELSALTEGAEVLINAVNPPDYTKWAKLWPPMAQSFLQAAQNSGAALLTIGNLYGYGEVTAPMTEETPLAATGVKGKLRADMWREAYDAHQAGRIRACELRASDYFGPSARPRTSMLNEFVIQPIAMGKTARLPIGNLDARHSWTYLPDICALAAALATDDRSWGRAWHVPTAEPRSLREVANDVAQLAGTTPRITRIPRSVMSLARVVPIVSALRETSYQFERDFIINSAVATETFGLIATDWRAALAATINGLQEVSQRVAQARQVSPVVVDSAT